MERYTHTKKDHTQKKDHRWNDTVEDECGVEDEDAVRRFGPQFVCSLERPTWSIDATVVRRIIISARQLATSQIVCVT